MKSSVKTIINQKVSAEKFIYELNSLNINDENGAHFTIMDAALLLTINAHSECSKTDYVEIIYGDREATKSSLDKPMLRLINAGLIESIGNPGAQTRTGMGRMLYRVSDIGAQLLMRCAK